MKRNAKNYVWFFNRTLTAYFDVTTNKIMMRLLGNIVVFIKEVPATFPIKFSFQPSFEIQKSSFSQKFCQGYTVTFITV